MSWVVDAFFEAHQEELNSLKAEYLAKIIELNEKIEKLEFDKGVYKRASMEKDEEIEYLRNTLKSYGYGEN